jgi:hypothetical protein
MLKEGRGTVLRVSYWDLALEAEIKPNVVETYCTPSTQPLQPPPVSRFYARYVMGYVDPLT